MRRIPLTIWCGTGETWPGGNYALGARELYAAAGFDVQVIDYMTSDRDFGDAARAPLHFITGSSTAVDDRSPNMSALYRALDGIYVRALKGEACVTGLCFGSQVTAEILGGQGACRPSPNGLEIGLKRLYRVGEQGSVVSSEFHFHEISPRFLQDSRVTHLFANEHSEVQGFRIGRNIECHQFHPDFPPDKMLLLLDNYQELMAAHGVEDQGVRAEVKANASAWDGGLLADCILRPMLNFVSRLEA